MPVKENNNYQDAQDIFVYSAKHWKILLIFIVIFPISVGWLSYFSGKRGHLEASFEFNFIPFYYERYCELKLSCLDKFRRSMLEQKIPVEWHLDYDKIIIPWHIKRSEGQKEKLQDIQLKLEAIEKEISQEYLNHLIVFMSLKEANYENEHVIIRPDVFDFLLADLHLNIVKSQNDKVINIQAPVFNEKYQLSLYWKVFLSMLVGVVIGYSFILFGMLRKNDHISGSGDLDL